MLFLGTTFDFFHITWSIESVGVITFPGILMLINSLSMSECVDKGEMRKAIAGSIIAVYIVLLAMFPFEKIGSIDMDTGVAETIIGHFTYLVGIVVIFYFGSRAVTEYREATKNKETTEEKKKKAEQ